jgi:hypothetical protein
MSIRNLLGAHEPELGLEDERLDDLVAENKSRAKYICDLYVYSVGEITSRQKSRGVAQFRMIQPVSRRGTMLPGNWAGANSESKARLISPLRIAE